MFTVSLTYSVELPPAGSYDRGVYDRQTADALGGRRAGTTEPTDAEVAEVMVRDYIERGHGCTAANYVRETRCVAMRGQR